MPHTKNSDNHDKSTLSRRSLLRAGGTLLAAGAFGGLAPETLFAEPAAKKLIIYYSRSGNTRKVAERIRQRSGADILEILPVTPYPEDYRACTDQAKKELADDFFPAIRPLAEKALVPYDIILLGSPNWWASWSGPMRTFLKENKLAGKAVFPFNTHGGGEWQSMLDHLKTFCPEARLELDRGLTIRDSHVGLANPDIDKWVRESGLAL